MFLKGQRKLEKPQETSKAQRKHAHYVDMEEGGIESQDLLHCKKLKQKILYFLHFSTAISDYYTYDIGLLFKSYYAMHVFFYFNIVLSF